MSVIFVDCETTGLDTDRHEIWEVAAVSDHGEWTWQLPVNLGLADPVALRIGRFHDRHIIDGHLTVLSEFAGEFATVTRGHHLAGAVVSFDEERLRKLLRANGACPEWHYHLVDVEVLAVGYLHAKGLNYPLTLPWDSELVSRWVGVHPENFDRHTALGDAKWAKAIYEAVTQATDGGEVS